MNHSDDLIKRIIDECRYVSFDVFDTAIYRDIPEEYIFSMIEKKTDQQGRGVERGFKRRRIEAERSARRIKGEGISISDIYDQLGYDKEKTNELIALEKELEIAACVVNRRVFDLYSYCKQKNKTVLFISDMYLDGDFIRILLKKCGYEGRVYVSCDFNRSKKKGDLFPEVIKAEGIDKKSWLHISDSARCDVIHPKRFGARVYWLKRGGNNRYVNKKFLDNPNYRMLLKVISNRCGVYEDEFERIGYEILGPLLYEFSIWLRNEIHREDGLFFLAREGRILKAAYDIVDPDNRGRYINVSRHAVYIPTLDNIQSFQEFREAYVPTIGRRASRLDHCCAHGISAGRAAELLKEAGYAPDESVSDTEDILRMLWGFWDDIKSNSRAQGELLRRYLDQNGLKTRNVLVDVGWQGTIQMCMDQIYGAGSSKGVSFAGRYVGSHNDRGKAAYNNLDKSGFLVNGDDKSFERLVIKYSLSLLELMFLSTEGTTNGYVKQGNEVVPELGAADNENRLNDLIIKLQNAALKCVRDISESCINTLTVPDKYAAFANYCQFAGNPELKNIRLFGKFYVDDGIKYRIVSEKSLLYYCFHLGEFKNDFLNNRCKIWFLKSVFKLNLPYVRLLTALSLLDK